MIIKYKEITYLSCSKGRIKMQFEKDSEFLMDLEQRYSSLKIEYETVVQERNSLKGRKNNDFCFGFVAWKQFEICDLEKNANAELSLEELRRFADKLQREVASKDADLKQVSRMLERVMWD